MAFRESDIQSAVFRDLAISDVDFDKARISGLIISDVNFKDVKNITDEQLGSIFFCNKVNVVPEFMPIRCTDPNEAAASWHAQLKRLLSEEPPTVQIPQWISRLEERSRDTADLND